MLSAARRHRHVIHIEKAPEHVEAQGAFGYTRRRLSSGANGRQLACSWYEIPPGLQAHPHHYHGGIEEAVFVLEGKGALRIGDDRIPIAAGDYIALPPGPENAHSILNTSEERLRYLCFSTVSNVDVIAYPDSKKLAFTARAPDGSGALDTPAWIDKVVHDQPSVDYYAGEDGDG